MEIADVAHKYHISMATLRYYEELGLLPPIAQAHGRRDFSPADLQRLEFILCMKDADMSLQTIKQYFELYDQGSATLPQRLALLETQKHATEKKLQAIAQAWAYLNYKIGLTKGHWEHSKQEHEKVNTLKLKDTD